MDEYISREAVVRYLKGYSEKELNWNAQFGMITSSVLDKAERALSEMPAADVQPVKHGHWIVTKTERGWNCAEYPVEWTCSECNVANDRKDDFCPHCGSYNRMGGDSE